MFCSTRNSRGEPSDHVPLIHPNYSGVTSSHAEVREVSSSLRQNSFISSLHMSVRADDRRYAAIQKPSHRDFFRSGFRMHINNAHLYFSQSWKHAFDHTKRIVRGRHENSAHQINYSNTGTIYISDPETVSRSIRRIVCRTNQPRLLSNIFDGLFLIEDMVPRRHHIDSGSK